VERVDSILLADDSLAFLMYLDVITKRLGFDTYTACDGEETIKLAKEKQPSLILLDYLMPRMKGTECLGLIRKDPEIKHIPVIIVSSLHEEITKNELERLGCCSFLKKPVNIAHLNMAIHECLEFSGKGPVKRKNIRTPLNFMALVEFHDEINELYATTLSQQGVFLRTITPFKPGTELEILFKIDQDGPIKLKGRVLYVIRLSPERRREPGMGIRFIDVPPDIKKRINSFVMKHIVKDIHFNDKN
jgi:CheY-like chemotaxis protein